MTELNNQKIKHYLDYLPVVKNYLNDLEHQDLWWTTVAMVGKINNENIDAQLLESIVETQREFQNLRNYMIESLVSRYLNQATSEITLNAQASIDMIIRNLFERTADVGFLATDQDLIEYLMDAECSVQKQAFIEHRIAEYVAKYSVYDDVVLLNPAGEVCAKYNPNNPAQICRDELVRQALSSNEPYLEVFRASDIFPNKPKSLIYAKRIEHRENGHSRNVGVLCLSFEFDKEMASIFSTLTKSQPGYKLMLLDQLGSVIASSCQKTYPLGKTLAKPQKQSAPSSSDKGIYYCTATHGYQGYSGLDWYSVAQADHRVAFERGSKNTSLNLNIEKHSPIYLHDLEEMNIKVSTLLLIVILNGKITSLKRDVKSFLPVLDSFQEISANIQTIFYDFIEHIHQVLISTIQSKVEFSAILAMEIMDRNLYERANDSRWWALNSVFRQLLTKQFTTGSLSGAEQAELTQILQYINELYTVYTNILIYDPHGKILAVSDKAQSSWIGKQMPAENDVRETMRLADTQAYQVSEFENTALYANKPTYVYHAAIKHWENAAKNVGGIAVVFDSQPEFKTMLTDAEPKYSNQTVNRATFSLFVTKNGMVISSTSEKYPAGSHLPLPQVILDAKNGESGAIAWQLDNVSCVLGYKLSQGYREFKTVDGYRNDVLSLVITAIE